MVAWLKTESDICACSDEMIDYNIEVAQHNWCCDDDSPCKQYYDGIITRKELIAFQKKMDSFAMKVKCLETGQRLPDLH